MLINICLLLINKLVVDIYVGVKVANKLYPLRVKFNNLSHRRSVLGNAKKLYAIHHPAFLKKFLSTQAFLGKKDSYM